MCIQCAGGTIRRALHPWQGGSGNQNRVRAEASSRRAAVPTHLRPSLRQLAQLPLFTRLLLQPLAQVKPERILFGKGI